MKRSVKKILTAIVMILSILDVKAFSITPNPVISRGKPIYSNIDQAKVSKLVDGAYCGSPYAPESWEAGSPTLSNPSWVAINVGSGYTSLLISMTSGSDGSGFEGAYCPGNYLIQTSANSTNGSNGTWAAVVTVTTNVYHRRAHSFDFTGKSWVRIYITAVGSQSTVVMSEIDIHNISNGISDTWAFVGDSNSEMFFQPGQETFTADVRAAHSAYYPAMISVAKSGTATGDWKNTLIDTYLPICPDFKYWCITLGTNDAHHYTPTTCVSSSVYKANLQYIIDEIKNAGHEPILAFVPAISSLNITANGGYPGFNELVFPNYCNVVSELTQENNLVCLGPDLFHYFLAHPEEMSADGYHLGWGTGQVSLNRLWAQSIDWLYSNDTSSPSAPGQVRDGATAGVDISSTSLTTQLSANWTAATDAESGISGYKYAIGTTAGGTNTANWTTLGNVLTVTKTGLSLTIGTTYYFSVKAVNGAGLSGPTTNSNGQVVVSTAVADTTPPGAPGIVRDGLTAGTDDSFTYSTTTLSANWTQAADSESGISGYNYAIGTAQGATNITNGWITNGTNLTVTKTGLTLTTGTTYYFSVKATNGSGLTGTAGNSNGQYVKVINTTDTTPPSNISEVRDGTGASDDAYTYITTELSANWSAAADAESGISRYLYAIGSWPGATNITNWTDNAQLTNVTQTGLTLTVGTTYYFSVKAENGVTLQSIPANSDGVYIISVELAPVISDVQAADITATSATTISWTTDKQATSQVEYGITAVYGSQTTEDSSLVTAHSMVITGLTAGRTYHYRVISKDSNGRTGTSADFTFTTLSTPNEVTDIRAYPNPYSLSNGEVIKFKVGAAGSEQGEIRIYTINGRLVRVLPAQGWSASGGTGTGEITWDGTNEDGEKVARGIYIYRITESNGDKITGKLAIVR